MDIFFCCAFIIYINVYIYMYLCVYLLLLFLVLYLNGSGPDSFLLLLLKQVGVFCTLKKRFLCGGQKWVTLGFLVFEL